MTNILLLATAPLDVVSAVVELAEKQHPGARFAMLVNKSAAERAADDFPGWIVYEYENGPVAPWNRCLPRLDILRNAGSGAVYYACNFFSPGEYVNVELTARMINRDKCFAATKHGIVEGAPVPPEVLKILETHDAQSAAKLIEEISLKNTFEFSTRSTTATVGPQVVGLLLTANCNYRCVMCPTHSDEVGGTHTKLGRLAPRGARELEYETVTRLIDELAEAGAKTITLSGYGEPLLYGKLHDLIRYISGRGMWCQINTNGYLMGEETRQIFTKNRMSMVSVSLNSHSPESYSLAHNSPPAGFTTVVENTKALLAARDASATGKLKIGFSFVITSRNVAAVGDMIDISERVGVDFALITPVFFPEHSNAEKLILDPEGIEFLRQVINSRKENSPLDIILKNTVKFDQDNAPNNYYRTYPCYHGWYYMIINPAGDATPCCGCDKVAGNIYNSSFDEIWNGPAYVALREKMRALPETRKSIEECGCFSMCPHVVMNRILHNKVLAANKNNI